MSSHAGYHPNRNTTGECDVGISNSELATNRSMMVTPNIPSLQYINSIQWQYKTWALELWEDLLPEGCSSDWSDEDNDDCIKGDDVNIYPYLRNQEQEDTSNSKRHRSSSSQDILNVLRKDSEGASSLYLHSLPEPSPLININNNEHLTATDTSVLKHFAGSQTSAVASVDTKDSHLLQSNVNTNHMDSNVMVNDVGLKGGFAKDDFLIVREKIINNININDENGNSYYEVVTDDFPEEEIICPIKSELLIYRKIGSGYYGDIFEGRIDGKSCAIKVPVCIQTTEGIVLSEEQAVTLQREIQCMRAIKYAKNIPQSILSYWGTLGLSSNVDMNTEIAKHASLLKGSIVMDLAVGAPLYEILFDCELYLSALIRRELAIQFLEALQFLHDEVHFLHRDVKTANLILHTTSSKRVGEEGILKGQGSYPGEPIYQLHICDYGKSVPMINGKAYLTENGGTPRYMPPEAYKIGELITAAVDVWPAALCVIEILGGQVPYECNHAWDAGPLTMLTSPDVPNDFPSNLHNILLRCLDFDMNMRPTMMELLNCVRSLSAEEMHEKGYSYKKFNDPLVPAVEKSISTI